jgi:hypothetical protein
MQFGADPKCPNSQGVSPLIVAEGDGDKRMVSILNKLEDPGEEQSLKNTPRKSQQFAVHEKRETPKKASVDAFPFNTVLSGLVVSVPLTNVTVKKCLITDFKVENENKDEMLQSISDIESNPSWDGSKVIENEETSEDLLCQRTSHVDSTDKPYMSSTHLEQDPLLQSDPHDTESIEKPKPFEKPSAVTEFSKKAMMKDAGEVAQVEESQIHVQSSSRKSDAHVESVGVDEPSNVDECCVSSADGHQQPMNKSELENESIDIVKDDADVSTMESVSDSQHRGKVLSFVERTLVSQTDQIDTETCSKSVRSVSHEEGGEHLEAMQESKDTIMQEDQNEFKSTGVLLNTEQATDMKQIDTCPPVEEQMSSVSQHEPDSPGTGDCMETSSAVECKEKDIPIQEQNSFPVILSLPPDHTYCGPPDAEFRPPISTDEADRKSPVSSSLECLLHAAEGSFLSSKSSPKPTSTNAQKTTIQLDRNQQSDDDEAPTMTSTSSAASAEDRSQLSFPVSLKFSHCNSTKTYSNAAEDPLFSLATIASGSSPYPTTSKSAQGHHLTTISSRCNRTPTLSAKGVKSIGQSQSNCWNSDSTSMLPPKKRFRPVTTSDIVSQRQAYSLRDMDCGKLLNFSTLSSCYDSLSSAKEEVTPKQTSKNTHDSACSLIKEQELQLKMLSTRHCREQERLRIHFESELIRAHTKANIPQPPPTVCGYLMEKLKTSDRKNSCCSAAVEGGSESNESRSSILEKKQKLLQSYVTDVWDKVYILKTRMCRRQTEELRNLKREHQEAFMNVISGIM